MLCNAILNILSDHIVDSGLAGLGAVHMTGVLSIIIHSLAFEKATFNVECIYFIVVDDKHSPFLALNLGFVLNVLYSFAICNGVTSEGFRVYTQKVA